MSGCFREKRLVSKLREVGLTSALREGRRVLSALRGRTDIASHGRAFFIGLTWLATAWRAGYSSSDLASLATLGLIISD